AMAHRRLNTRGRDALLDSTALVHEAFLKIFGRSPPNFQDRKHFFSVAAIAMRQIICDGARRRLAIRRGSGAPHADIDAVDVPAKDRAEEIVAVNEALSRLASLDERLARLVELRYFGGLSIAEVAEVMETSESTVEREWKKARALLRRMLVADGGS